MVRNRDGNLAVRHSRVRCQLLLEMSCYHQLSWHMLVSFIIWRKNNLKISLEILNKSFSFSDTYHHSSVKETTCAHTEVVVKKWTKFVHYYIQKNVQDDALTLSLDSWCLILYLLIFIFRILWPADEKKLVHSLVSTSTTSTCSIQKWLSQNWGMKAYLIFHYFIMGIKKTVELFLYYVLETAT